MAKCTAPYRGHKTASGAAACPACRGRYRGYGASSYSSLYPSYSSSGGGNRVDSGNSFRSNVGRKPSWSGSSSRVTYSYAEIQALTPIRRKLEEQGNKPDRRDVFLCHAWDDRNSTAKELHDLLEINGISVWFSEKDVMLGSNLLREIDKGLAKSRIGIVLVTPSLLRRLEGASIADKELSALLAREQLIPIVHNTTYEALREVSPLLASRTGLSTTEDSISEVAIKLAELVTL